MIENDTEDDNTKDDDVEDDDKEDDDNKEDDSIKERNVSTCQQQQLCLSGFKEKMKILNLRCKCQKYILWQNQQIVIAMDPHRCWNGIEEWCWRSLVWWSCDRVLINFWIWVD